MKYNGTCIDQSLSRSHHTRREDEHLRYFMGNGEITTHTLHGFKRFIPSRVVVVDSVDLFQIKKATTAPTPFAAERAHAHPSSTVGSFEIRIEGVRSFVRSSG